MHAEAGAVDAASASSGETATLGATTPRAVIFPESARSANIAWISRGEPVRIGAGEKNARRDAVFRGLREDIEARVAIVAFGPGAGFRDVALERALQRAHDAGKNRATDLHATRRALSGRHEGAHGRRTRVRWHDDRLGARKRKRPHRFSIRSCERAHVGRRSFANELTVDELARIAVGRHPDHRELRTARRRAAHAAFRRAKHVNYIDFCRDFPLLFSRLRARSNHPPRSRKRMPALRRRRSLRQSFRISKQSERDEFLLARRVGVMHAQLCGRSEDGLAHFDERPRARADDLSILQRRFERFRFANVDNGRLDIAAELFRHRIELVLASPCDRERDLFLRERTSDEIASESRGSMNEDLCAIGHGASVALGLDRVVSRHEKTLRRFHRREKKCSVPPMPCERCCEPLAEARWETYAALKASELSALSR